MQLADPGYPPPAPMPNGWLVASAQLDELAARGEASAADIAGMESDAILKALGVHSADDMEQLLLYVALSPWLSVLSLSAPPLSSD